MGCCGKNKFGAETIKKKLKSAEQRNNAKMKKLREKLKKAN